MQSFKAGNFVRCIDAEESHGMLHEGWIYQVRHDTYDAFVTLEDMSREWHVTRFELVEGMQ